MPIVHILGCLSAETAGSRSGDGVMICCAKVFVVEVKREELEFRVLSEIHVGKGPKNVTFMRL
jgi:hypothetical protein